MGQRQTQSTTLDARSFGSEPFKRPEQPVHGLGWESVAVVLDLDPDPGSGDGHDAHPQGAALASVLQRVADQVEQDLPQPAAVGVGDQRLGRRDDPADAALLRERFDQLDDTMDDLQDVDGSLSDVTAPGLQPGEIEHVVDEGLHVPATGDDAFDVLVQLCRQWFELQKLGETQHGVERGAQLVAEACDELVLGPGLPFGGFPGADVLGVMSDDHDGA